MHAVASQPLKLTVPPSLKVVAGTDVAWELAGDVEGETVSAKLTDAQVRL